MNLYRIINDIKSTCMSHRDVQGFHYGDIYEYENTKSLKYINTNFTLQNISSGFDSDTKTINGVLFCVDRLTDNGDNKLIVQSRCTDILQNIMIRMTENYGGWSFENVVYEVFSEKFSDLCAGCFCTFSLSVDEDSVCSDDDFVVKTMDIKANGIYDVIGYDRIIVDIQPKLKEIEIVENGVYLPEKGSDGYNKITVDVPPTPVQEKSVEITENGTTSVLPDEGYNLSKVDVNVNVNAQGSLKLANGTKLGQSIFPVLPDYDFSDITYMSYMFSSCKNLKTIPLLDTSNVTDMSGMFNNCKNLKTIPLLDTSNVTNIDSMFNKCPSLTTIPNLDTSNVTNLFNTFNYCLDLTDLGGFTNMGKAFTSSHTLLDISYTDKLTNQSVQNIIDTVFDMNQNTKGGKATLKLAQTVIDAMTDTQKSQLAAKGWTLTN